MYKPFLHDTREKRYFNVRKVVNNLITQNVTSKYEGEENLIDNLDSNGNTIPTSSFLLKRTTDETVNETQDISRYE